MRYTRICDWTVRGSNFDGGEIFLTRPDQNWDLHSLLYNEYRFFFPKLKGLGRDVDHQPHLVLKLKKEDSYTSIPSAFKVDSGVNFKFVIVHTIWKKQKSVIQTGLSAGRRLPRW